MMKIELGKSYLAKGGWKAEVIEFDALGNDEFRVRHFMAPRPQRIWHFEDGRANIGGDYDLISEWTDIDLSNPLGVVFGMMPPETQEAMKAHGGPWEMYGRRGWTLLERPKWDEDTAYRVKPAPKVETVTLYGGREGDTAEYGFYETGAVVQSHRITFNLIDGKPDCASIKMEEL